MGLTNSSKKTMQQTLLLLVLSVLTLSITANPVFKRCSKAKIDDNDDYSLSSKEEGSSLTKPLSERADYLIEDIQLNPLNALSQETANEDDYGDYISDIFDLNQHKLELSDDEKSELEAMSKEKESIMYFKDC